jgi:hypothetical protein
LKRNTVQKILKAENGRIEKDKERMTEKRNQRELLWFQTGGTLNFITAAPHCGESNGKSNGKYKRIIKFSNATQIFRFLIDLPYFK